MDCDCMCSMCWLEILYHRGVTQVASSQGNCVCPGWPGPGQGLLRGQHQDTASTGSCAPGQSWPHTDHQLVLALEPTLNMPPMMINGAPSSSEELPVLGKLSIIQFLSLVYFAPGWAVPDIHLAVFCVMWEPRVWSLRSVQLTQIWWLPPPPGHRLITDTVYRVWRGWGFTESRSETKTSWSWFLILEEKEVTAYEHSRGIIIVKTQSVNLFPQSWWFMTSKFGKVIVRLDNNCNGHPINNGLKEVFLREDNKKLTSSVLCSICWRHCLVWSSTIWCYLGQWTKNRATKT